jgi:hypothetical protein
MNEGSFFYDNCQETYVVVSRYTISIMSSRRNSLYNVIDCLDAYAVSNIISIYEEGVFSLM